MKEQKANMLSTAIIDIADCLCFTSNGIVKSNGELVMGAGVAKAFKVKWPELPGIFGMFVLDGGNQVYEHAVGPTFFYSPTASMTKILCVANFPTKYDWRDNSDIDLIIKSSKELMAIINELNWTKVYLSRPGVGLGGLDWDKEVKPAIKDILDDRVIVCYL